MSLVVIKIKDLKLNKRAGERYSLIQGRKESDGKGGYTRSVQRIFHRPLPRYNYSHENPEIQCWSCGEKTLLEDLESDEVIIDYETYPVEHICIHCKTHDCCDIHYETVDEYFERTGTSDNDVAS